MRVVITGASDGIGRELADVFARHGHDLFLVARRGDRLAELAAELSARFGARCEAHAADLTDPAARVEVARVVGPRGADILVNNAGVGHHGPFVDATSADDASMIELNVTALTHLTRLFLPGMLTRRQGKVLNVASVAAFVPGPFFAVYYATKAYVLSFSEALAQEVRGTGVTVTTLCPGTTRTGFQRAAGLDERGAEAMPSLMSAADVARAAYQGTMRGDRIVVPGGRNRLFVFLARHAPRSLVARTVRRLQEKRMAVR